MTGPMHRSLAWPSMMALCLLCLWAPALRAHPTSTFGVRLNVSGQTVTMTMNADIAPLLGKLDALSGVGTRGGEPLDRVRAHADQIGSLSHLSADGTAVTLTIGPVRTNADGQAEIVLIATLPQGARTVSWQSRLIYGAYPLSVSHGADAVETVLWLQGPEASQPIPARGPTQAVSTLATYTALGFEHIIPKGLDHILFVLGLFLLTPRPRALIAQVSVFTLAHSVSLALAIFGVVSLPAAIVEPLIALSIAYVGVENLFQRALTRRRLWLVAAFGLLHGLGFAAVLSELSLPAAQWLPALFGFNLGVELGQLAVITLAAATMYFGARWVDDADQWLRRPASAGIALMGVFWMITRL